ncbi:MAG: hypothetical protein ABJB74_23040 [Gemmatimonas sp.]
MYATCLFCHASLGANESIEHFPVGRRLAFDAAKGRLWVVCGKCERWNLSPLDERWEAIEEAERAYRDSKKRVATDNVGLARLSDGTDLIRVGAPLRPEFAAWRYGEIFGTRRTKFIKQMVALGFVGQFASHFGLSAAAAAGVGGFAVQLGTQLSAGLWQARHVKVAVRDDAGRIHPLARGEASTARYGVDRESGSVRVDVTSRHGLEFSSAAERSYQRVLSLSSGAYDERYVIRLTGNNALRALSNLMPTVNLAGGSAKDVSQATALVASAKSPDRLFRQIATGDHRSRWQFGNTAMIARTTPDMRLALEMALHEADEHRALDGELHELEQRWKEAEEIANIADGLTLPEGMTETVDALRHKATRETNVRVPESGG